MKATELQIGDWVNFYRSPLSKNGIYYDIIIELDTYDVECNPIPLTAEIMEKNGFAQTEHGALVKDDVYFYPATNKSHFTNIDHPHISIHPYWKREKVSLRCDYVHIVQHIFRLCGLNELADNFQV